jgi:hypothetical protein
MDIKNVRLSTEQLVYIVAAVGRVSNPTDLYTYEYLESFLSIGHRHEAEELAAKMEFSK